MYGRSLVSGTTAPEKRLRPYTLFHGFFQRLAGSELQTAKERGRLAEAAAPPPPPEKKDKPKRSGGTKNLEKEVNAAERAVAAAEERMFDLEQAIQEASADYLKLQELYEQREALEDELAHLYAVWERLAADLEEARG